jgi:hypothetical protein
MVWSYKPVIPATQEVKARQLRIQVCPRQMYQDPVSKKQKKRQSKTKHKKQNGLEE